MAKVRNAKPAVDTIDVSPSLDQQSHNLPMSVHRRIVHRSGGRFVSPPREPLIGFKNSLTLFQIVELSGLQ